MSMFFMFSCVAKIKEATAESGKKATESHNNQVGATNSFKHITSVFFLPPPFLFRSLFL